MRQAYLDTVDKNPNRPTVQATLSYVTRTATNLVLNLSSIGNGDNCLIIGFYKGYGDNILLTPPIPLSTFPIDGTNYTANTIFGSGSSIGNGFAVYKGNTNNNITISGLSRGSTYTFYALSFDSVTNTYLTDPSAIQNRNTQR